jgi:hypothetical protein
MEFMDLRDQLSALSIRHQRQGVGWLLTAEAPFRNISFPDGHKIGAFL